MANKVMENAKRALETAQIAEHLKRSPSKRNKKKRKQSLKVVQLFLSRPSFRLFVVSFSICSNLVSKKSGKSA